MSAVNESEVFVHDLCRCSFLSVWSVENPIGPNQGKELADAVVVVGEDVVLISVKEPTITPSGDPSRDADRWYRRAVQGSIKQLKGALRALDTMTDIARRDNPEVRLPLPPTANRRVYFIAVALSGEGLAPTVSERHDFGLVHVFDRGTWRTLIRELDTVTDFLSYLKAKEDFLTRSYVEIEESERDLLAIYLLEGRSFPVDWDGLFVNKGLWAQLEAEPAFQRRKEAEKVSYAWDQLVEKFAGHLRAGTLLGPAAPTQVEAGLRYMVCESRFNRRLLGEAFTSYLEKAGQNGTRSRVVSSHSGVVYVFIAVPRQLSFENRDALLTYYCAVLREEHACAPAVVAILTERPDGIEESSFALGYMDCEVNDEVRELAEQGRSRGILSNQTQHSKKFREYPDS